VKKLIIPLVIVLVLAFLIPACSSGTASTTPATTAPVTSAAQPTTSAPAASATPQSGGTLTWNRNTGIPVLGAPTDIPTQTNTYLLGSPAMETLVLCDAQENIVGNLAESVETSADGKAVTFHLVKGVKFQDGTDFNAAAVKYNLEGVLKANCSGSAVLKNVTSYDIKDDYTITMNLTKYDSRLLLALAQSGIGFMVSPTALAKPTTPDNAPKDHMVGTGPFKFDSWAKDQFIKFTKWDGYRVKGRPYVDTIIIKNFANVTTSIMSFKNGEANMVENINPEDVAPLKAAGYFTSAPQMAFVFSMSPDSANADSPFAKKQVREAVEYAIDKKGNADGLGKGTQYAAVQLGTPKDAWFMKDYTPRDYNPAKAKQLLTEAGYPNGFKYTLATDVRIRDDQALSIQQNLKDVGIDLTIDKADVARATTWAQSGWKGLLQPGFPNWDAFTSWTARYSNVAIPYPSIAYPGGLAAYTKAWDDMASIPDFTQRMAKMQSLMKQLLDDALVIPYMYDSPRYVTDNTVMDMSWDARNTNGYFDPVNVWLKKK
jgi:ABC-type transport system substrate-binding protein